MEILPGLFIVLPAPDHELALLDGHIELVAGETSNRQGDAQTLRPAAFARDPFDVVRRVSVGGLGDPIERPFNLVEAEQERAR